MGLFKPADDPIGQRGNDAVCHAQVDDLFRVALHLEDLRTDGVLLFQDDAAFLEQICTVARGGHAVHVAV